MTIIPIREPIMAALFLRIQTIPLANTYSRRLAKAQVVNPPTTPAIYQVEHAETTERRWVGTPPKRILMPEIWYYDTINSPLPSLQSSPGATSINTFFDQLETALLPDNFIKNTLTLGGLVYYCRLESRHLKEPGDWGEKVLAIAKLKIVVP